MLDLHFWPTPNGKKVTILLEELGLKYNLVPCNIGRGDQFKPEFLKMNPNHRMPVLVDHEPKGGGAPISIFESGAIMMYLAEKEGRFFPQDVRGKYEVTQWVIWQMANQGPKLGECGHFRRAGPEAGDLSYAIRRFTDEANRLYGVMNNRLYDRRYLAGDEYTIADMISYPWTVSWEGPGTGHQRVQIFQALVRGGRQPPRGQARHGDRQQSARRPGDPDARGARSGCARSCTTSARSRLRRKRLSTAVVVPPRKRSPRLQQGGKSLDLRFLPLISFAARRGE